MDIFKVFLTPFGLLFLIVMFVSLNFLENRYNTHMEERKERMNERFKKNECVVTHNFLLFKFMDCGE